MIKKLTLEPSLILYNGKVHTVDQDDSIAQAVAICGDRILAVGDNDSIKALGNSRTEMIDLLGRSVIPGIIDSHNHAWEAGKMMEGIVTFGIMSIEELKQAIRERAKDMKPGEWLQGGGFIESQFAERRIPTRYDLDEAAPHIPVVIERIFSTCVANSLALKLAGIDKDTPDPEGGEIGRDAVTGEPNGQLFRSAKMLVRKAMPGPFGASTTAIGENGLKDCIKRALGEYVKLGITGVVEPGVTPAICRAYQDLRQSGELLMRINLMPNWYGFALEQDFEHMERLIGEMGFYTGFGDEWLRLGALKMAIDGGLTSRTALKSWAYVDEPGPREHVPLRLDLDKLDDYVKTAHDAGWSVGIHVMGDIAQEKAVDAIYKAHQANPGERRHQIIHGYYPTEESLARMKEIGIIAALQPSFTYGEADGYPDLLSEEKQHEFLPIRSYHKRGVTVAISTDMPSAHYNPFWGMYAAMTRKGMQGHQLGTAECVGLNEVIRMMTLNGAYLTGEEMLKGSIEPGKLADLAVIDRDLSVVPLEEIRDLSVDLTLIAGKVVYQR